MQLLRDNLTLWTSDMQGEGEEKGGDEDKPGTCRELYTNSYLGKRVMFVFFVNRCFNGGLVFLTSWLVKVNNGLQ